MASSKRWASVVCSFASLTYFAIIIFQVPILRVPCRSGICKTPLQVISCQLIASDLFPLFIVKALLYPGALARAFYEQKTIPSFRKFNIKPTSATSDIQRLEVLAGSYLSVAGAFLGLIKPGRMSLSEY
ncbi:hypothetical protein L6164_021596 [Bauhinia variegata]|uniref:Uncharacterized protein n=1 Tax=Bauhinia variegata TaxID=167791 RepID=A0ACB9N0Y7_BAUVA|nr:hypothetical protein L6164_021596 [Bauhinia variegata]